MKKFFTNVAFVALFAALGYLGWRNYELLRENTALRETRVLLEQEKRELQAKVVAGPTEKPEESVAVRMEIERQTASLRGLPFKKPVTYKTIGRDELRKVLEQKLAEQYSTGELRDYSLAFQTLGLIPEGTDLGEAILSLYDEQVAAFYVPEEHALYTFKDESFSKNLDKVTLAHELTHALQDQNFDLLTFPLKVKDNDDLALATSSLVEGDATLLMAQYYGEHLDVRNMLGDVMGGMLGQKTAKFQSAPAFLQQLLLFPYQEGTEFVMAIFANGGTDAINEVFKHPPVSTQQILHPDKFLHNRHDPEKIATKKLDAPGWRLIADNVLGEFGLRALLTQNLTVLEAQRLAAGWNGDRYQVYERGTNGPTALVWTTAWDTDQSAADFAEAYRRLAEKRGVTVQIDKDATHVRLRQAKTPGTLDELRSAQELALVYRIDKSELNSEVWRKAIATARDHIATGKSQMGGTGVYTLMRVVLKNPDPKERIEVHAVKLKDLKPEYYGGGEALRFLCDGEFVFFEHINGASRRNNQDPLVLKSTVRGANTIWVDVPKQWEVQVLGDIIVEHP